MHLPKPWDLFQTCDPLCTLDYFGIKCSSPQYNTPNNLDNCAIRKPGGKQGHWKELMNKTQVPITSSFNLANRWLCQWKAIQEARSAKPFKIIRALISCQRIKSYFNLKLQNSSLKRQGKKSYTTLCSG